MTKTKLTKEITVKKIKQNRYLILWCVAKNQIKEELYCIYFNKFPFPILLIVMESNLEKIYFK